jgi:uncharacterized membrane protein SirB2
VFKRVNLIGALFLLAISALLLHIRIHPIMVKPQGAVEAGLSIPHLLAVLFCLVDVVLVSLLFCFPNTSIYGYLINGLLVIYATILMGHFSLHELIANSPAFWSWLYGSTLPDIAIAWADFLIGRSLFLGYQNASG